MLYSGTKGSVPVSFGFFLGRRCSSISSRRIGSLLFLPPCLEKPNFIQTAVCFSGILNSTSLFSYQMTSQQKCMCCCNPRRTHKILSTEYEQVWCPLQPGLHDRASQKLTVAGPKQMTRCINQPLADVNASSDSIDLVWQFAVELTEFQS